jgi:heme exporter protein C
MHRFANPTRFVRLADVIIPWAIGMMALLFAGGLYMALMASPPDYQQGDTVRIMYIHVPAAWMAMFTYASMATAAIVGIIWRHAVADLYCKAVAPIGAGFTVICLATGSLWGQPMWGTWWVWDARLTSVLILLFFYLGYMALVTAFDDQQRGLRAGGILIIVGSINLPIIKFSVDWWNTLHQPASISRLDAPAIDPSMLPPLALMTAAFIAYFTAFALIRTRMEIQRRKAEAMRTNRALAMNFQ